MSRKLQKHQVFVLIISFYFSEKRSTNAEDIFVLVPSPPQRTPRPQAFTPPPQNDYRSPPSVRLSTGRKIHLRLSSSNETWEFGARKHGILVEKALGWGEWEMLGARGTAGESRAVGAADQLGRGLYRKKELSSDILILSPFSLRAYMTTHLVFQFTWDDRTET